jgi:hypothetical protein
MKTILFNTIFFSMSLTWAITSAAVDSAEAVQKLVEIITAHTDSSGKLDNAGICQESGAKKTLRMEAGKYCSDPLFGNFALLMCDDFVNFAFERADSAKIKKELSALRCGFMQSKCMKTIDSASAGNILPFEYKTIISQLKNLIARITYNPENKKIICRAIPPLPAYKSICP